MGPIGVQEMIFVFVLALLIFGPRKLPELGRTVGKALAEFRRASAEVRLAVEDEMRELERQARELAREAERAVSKAQDDSPSAGRQAGAGAIDPTTGAPPHPPGAAGPAEST